MFSETHSRSRYATGHSLWAISLKPVAAILERVRRTWSHVRQKNSFQIQYSGACPRRKTAYAFLGHALAGFCLLSGCTQIEGACGLGLAHRDCPLFAGEMPQVPSDDAICRSYGLKYGSPDYARCRAAKAAVRADTKETIDREWWKNPL